MNTNEILNNLIFSLNATMPIFFVMVIGWFMKRYGLIDEHTTTKMNQLVFKIFLPAMLFVDLAEKNFIEIWDTKMVVFCFVVTILSILIGGILSLLSKNREERGEIIQAAYRSGAATLGIVFMSNIYDEISMIALMIIGSVPLYNMSAVIILFLTSPENRNQSKKELCKRTLKNVVTNPMIISIFLGVIWSVCRLPQPPMFMKTVTYLGNIASPMALIALGASFEFYNVKEKYKETIGISFTKLFLLCIVFLPVAILLGFRDEKLVAILVMLGSATTSSSFVMAKNMGHKGTISSCAVMVTTLLSSFSLTIWLFLLRMREYI